MSDDAPGGSVGCDVCGVAVDAERASVHSAWHRADDERFAGISEALRLLVDQAGQPRE